MDCPDILVLRHGETEWNVEGRLQGRLDSPLTPAGLDQARRQNRVIRGLDLAGWQAFTSPQPRAVRTAGIALDDTGLTAGHDDRLAEIAMGDWSGRTRDDIAAGAPHVFAGGPLDWYDHAPGGEGFAALEARCRSFLGGLAGPAVIVTHGITSRMLRALALGMPVHRLGDLPGGQGIVHRVRDRVHDTIG